MEANLMDELFEKINKLENEQKALIKELDDTNKALELKSINLIGKMFTSEEKENESIAAEEAKKRLEALSNEINSRIESKGITHVFSYYPIDSSYTSVYISGDFNNWAMKDMRYEGNTFTCSIQLLKGYEYAYCFYSNGELLVDFDLQYKEIPYRNSNVHNYIIIPDGTEEVKVFNSEKDADLIKQIENSPIQIKGNETEFLRLLAEMNQICQNNIKKYNQQRREKLTFVQSSYNEQTKKLNETYENILRKFKETFEGRIISQNNSYFIIKHLEMREKAIKCFRLYDPNGLRTNLAFQAQIHHYSLVKLDDLFVSAIILSKEESDQIIFEFDNDKSNYIKIYYQLVSEGNSKEKSLVPYKIQPETININEYNIVINDNIIKEVMHKNSHSFIMFDATLIGEGKNTAGLVGTSLIKVYTTLYNKDILNILHIHLNDTSQEITIDSVFLENDENVLNHKIFKVDVMGNRLKYKMLFRNYKLIQIYYAMSEEFIDEPAFEEVRFNSNSYVKISKGEYKNFFGKIKQFPLGMLARKDKNETEIQKMKSFGYQKEADCGDRHLEELPGYASIEVLFQPGPSIILLDKPVHLSLPICNLIPLSPKEEVMFEKNEMIDSNMKKDIQMEKLMKLANQFKQYEQYLQNEKLLDQFNVDQLKEIVSQLEKEIKVNEEFSLILDESQEQLSSIQAIKEALSPILYQKIRIVLFKRKEIE